MELIVVKDVYKNKQEVERNKALSQIIIRVIKSKKHQR